MGFSVPKRYQTALFMVLFIITLVTVVSIFGVANGKEGQKKRNRQDSSLNPDFPEAFPLAVEPIAGINPGDLGDEVDICIRRNLLNINVGVANLDLVNGNYKLKIDITPCGDFIDRNRLAVGKSLVLGVNIYNLTAGNPVPSLEFGSSFDSGDINNYPFDKYKAKELYLEASFFNKTSNSTELVPMMVFFNAGLLTYSVSKETLENVGSEIPPSYTNIVFGFRAKRSFTTVFFSGLIMSIMWALSLLAVFLAVTLWIKGRKVEPPTIAFSIALIFALPGIRNTQPGGPPIGCTADVVSFFWAMVLSAVTASLLLLNYIVKYNFEPDVCSSGGGAGSVGAVGGSAEKEMEQGHGQGLMASVGYGHGNGINSTLPTSSDHNAVNGDKGRAGLGGAAFNLHLDDITPASASENDTPFATMTFTPIPHGGLSNMPPALSLVQLFTTPTFIQPLLICLALQPVLYLSLTFLFPKTFNTPKQKAWILTAFSSLVMTVASFPYLWDFFTTEYGLDSAACMGWEKWSHAICAFFVSYCLGDLIVGHVMYRSEMNPWSGYFHHTLYTFMVSNLTQLHLGPAFILFGILELPTLLMAMGSIHKPLRNDLLFGFTFFTTRLAFHAYLTFHLGVIAFPYTTIFLYPLSVMPLHVMWFSGWIKQQRRIMKKNGTAEKIAVSRQEAYRKAVALKDRILQRTRALGGSVGGVAGRHARPQRPLSESGVGSRRGSVPEKMKSGRDFVMERAGLGAGLGLESGGVVIEN
ncbi:hypothetical protein HDU97_010287 [Phlyctochytrium planicorne]|nr:hypothetical protein HDU97_010287 [Phlyctochytrium planicorne]